MRSLRKPRFPFILNRDSVNNQQQIASVESVAPSVREALRASIPYAIDSKSKAGAACGACGACVSESIAGDSSSSFIIVPALWHEEGAAHCK